MATLYGGPRGDVNAGVAGLPSRLAQRGGDGYLWLDMTFKLDGAKFPSIEELVEALYPLYQDRMGEEEFRKYVEENAERG